MIDINELRKELNTLCYRANVKEIKDFLLLYSLEVNYNRGEPLIWAIRSLETKPMVSEKQSLDACKVLVSAGADIHINEDAPIRWAMRVDNHAVVKYLLEQGHSFVLDHEDVENYLSRNTSLDKNLFAGKYSIDPKQADLLVEKNDPQTPHSHRMFKPTTPDTVPHEGIKFKVEKDHLVLFIPLPKNI